MNYFRRVASSIKNGVNVELTPRTVIVGPNGAGKSAVLQALELATLGSVSDAEGRGQMRQPHAIARLFPSSVDIWSTATTDDGTEFSWKLARREGGFREPEAYTPFGVAWPVKDLKAVLHGESAGIRTWLEGKVSRVDLDVALAEVPPILREDIEKWAKIQNSTDLLKLAKDARDEARSLRAEATKALKLVDQSLVGISPPLSQLQRADLETLAAQPLVGVTRLEHDAVTAELVAHRHKAQQLQAALAALPSPDDGEALRKINAAIELIDEHNRIFDDKLCRVCGSRDVQLAERRKMLSDKRASLEEAYKIHVQRQKISASIVVLHNEIQQLEVRANLPVQDTTRAREASARLAADTATAQIWRNASASRMAAEQKKIRADRLTTMAEQLDAVGRRFLANAKEEFERRVTTLLPNGNHLGVDLQSARLGFQRGTADLHSALSGGEENILYVSLALEAQPAASISIVSSDDRGWDPVTLQQAMLGWRRVEGHQIVLMSTVMPEPVEGWSCLDLR